MTNAGTTDRLEAVILDVDGTLIDSNDAHARAFVEAAEELGFPGGDFTTVRRLIGMGADRLIPRVYGFESEASKGKALGERKDEIFRGRYLPSLRPTPGARALLERMRAEGLRLVVATSATEDDLHALLERAGVADLIARTTSASEVENSKPAPDVVESALADAGAPADRVVMIGDTPYDVEAATRAGVRLIGVRCGGWDDEALRGAVAVYDDPADLLRDYRSSPLARDG